MNAVKSMNQSTVKPQKKLFYIIFIKLKIMSSTKID